MIGFDEREPKIKELGNRLKQERLKRDENQNVFASRINVSVPTLRKMESGDGSVTLSLWVATLELLGRLEDIDSLLKPSNSLFEKLEGDSRPQRKRASRKKNNMECD